MAPPAHRESVDVPLSAARLTRMELRRRSADHIHLELPRKAAAQQQRAPQPCVDFAHSACRPPAICTAGDIKMKRHRACMHARICPPRTNHLHRVGENSVQP
eukprot:CAMPEP_0181183326 /NCGR_PEP_ID=MMETSP1096-20121128/8368_1 /TAXON_ID=156174 ORGANISM="Chrysochromulina ericina, Strain CCMP281" /NCGR_SAMPLE_ID=MMETSP1096 /ASSEMBLY_ACC=CAM_ASM_000453 /LENGTH=101 /DNA_ID=CAMNT_0023272003 /DNA_START=848 /DNA_END=1150 /DNA_ORIENTATION=-